MAIAYSILESSTPRQRVHLLFSLCIIMICAYNKLIEMYPTINHQNF